MKDAIDEGIIHSDFTRRVSISGGKASKRAEEKLLKYEDSDRLINNITEKMNSISGYLIVLALTSGLRLAEFVGLTRKDFDFEKNELKVTTTWGYTNKMHVGFGPTINPQSVRTIKIDQKTMDKFKEFSTSILTIVIVLYFSAHSQSIKRLTTMPLIRCWHRC